MIFSDEKTDLEQILDHHKTLKMPTSGILNHYVPDLALITRMRKINFTFTCKNIVRDLEHSHDNLRKPLNKGFGRDLICVPDLKKGGEKNVL